MTRAWGIKYEDVLYHVLSRVNERQDIVINDDDRRLFLDTAGEMGERFGIDICNFIAIYACERPTPSLSKKNAGLKIKGLHP